MLFSIRYNTLSINDYLKLQPKVNYVALMALKVFCHWPIFMMVLKFMSLFIYSVC